ncbi:MAG: hypothetical protein H6832_00250 [Planctomycetes bacterium]|nr:hypothetical protein [Planctomycetota bacterium]MCB9916813.1 hypothetical protein [Planctomycetota bacterium]
MRALTLTVLTTCCLSVSSIPAQNNLVGNGDFESTTLAPWIVISGQNNVSVADNVAVGSGIDRALFLQGDARLTQSIIIPEDGYYQLGFSARRSKYTEHADLSFGSNTQVWAQLQTGSWCPSGHLVEGGRPVLLKKGAYPLWITVTGAKSLYIDEVVLRRVALPFLFYTDTTYGSQYARSFLVQHDRFNNVIVPIMSSHRFSTAVHIPTFAGDFWLDPSRGFWFAMPAVISSSNYQKALQLPLSLPVGLDAGLFLQTIDISGRMIGSRLYVHLRG